MPKYRKDRKYTEQKQEIEREEVDEKVRMFKGSWLPYFIALACLVLSIIFNAELVRPFGTDPETGLKVLEYGFRGVLVAGFFFFTLVSWGNLKELRGSIIGLKEIIILIILSLIQTVRNGYVCLAASVGITIACVYIWLMQEKLRESK